MSRLKGTNEKFPFYIFGFLKSLPPQKFELKHPLAVEKYSYWSKKKKEMYSLHWCCFNSVPFSKLHYFLKHILKLYHWVNSCCGGHKIRKHWGQLLDSFNWMQWSSNQSDNQCKVYICNKCRTFVQNSSGVESYQLITACVMNIRNEELEKNVYGQLGELPCTHYH